MPVAAWFFATPKRARTAPIIERVEVFESDNPGIAVFCDPGTELKVVQQQFGAEFRRRVPTEAGFIKLDEVGSVLRDAALQALTGAPWWDLLLLGSLAYAKKKVICVAPPDFRISLEIQRLAASHGKCFQMLPLTLFSPEEQQRLKKRYEIDFPDPEDGIDVNSAEHQQRLSREYSHIFNAFPY